MWVIAIIQNKKVQGVIYRKGFFTEIVDILIFFK